MCRSTHCVNVYDPLTSLLHVGQLAVLLGLWLSDQNICACAAYTRPVQVNLGVNWWPSHNDR